MGAAVVYNAAAGLSSVPCHQALSEMSSVPHHRPQGEYRTTDDRPAAANQSNFADGHRMAGDYRTHLCVREDAPEFVQTPSTFSSEGKRSSRKRTRRFDLFRPKSTAEASEGFVPVGYPPANPALMGQGQLKVLRRSLRKNPDRRHYGFRTSSPVNPNRSSFDGSAAQQVNRATLDKITFDPPPHADLRLSCWGTMTCQLPPPPTPWRPRLIGVTGAPFGPARIGSTSVPDPRGKTQLANVLLMAPYQGTNQSMHQTDYQLWNSQSRRQANAPKLTKPKVSNDSMVDYSRGCCQNRVGMYNSGGYAHDYRPEISKAWPWLI